MLNHNMYPKVSVVMSNYNGVKLGLLPKSLKSILSNNYPSLEVILVDNASTDNSVAVVKKMLGKNKNLKLIENPVNMYSRGLNLGVKTAAGKYVAFFNNDARVDDGYFQKFVKFLDKNPKIALAQGKLLSSKNNKLIDSAGEIIDIYGNPTSIGNGMNAEQNFNKSVDLLSVSGSCSILRKSAVAKIGYFDEAYGIGYEDLDLAMRVWMRGFEVKYYPNVYVFHERGATDLAPMIRLKVRWHFNKNRIATIIKNYPPLLAIKALLGVFVIYTLLGMWEIFVKNNFKLGILRFTSIWWIVINLPTILSKRTEVMRLKQKKGYRKMFSLFSERSLIESMFAYLKS